MPRLRAEDLRGARARGTKHVCLEDRKISKALKRLVMLARVVGLVPQGPKDLKGSKRPWRAA